MSSRRALPKRWTPGCGATRSRRTFLQRLVELGGATALARPGLALLGTSLGASAARAAVELADPSTPFGQAQAAAVKASTEGPPENSAYRAVQAAKQYEGSTINMTYESGLQALEPRNFSGPLWQDLTGIGFNVEELPHPDQYSKPIAEHIAGSGAYDILDIEPAWIPVDGQWRGHPADRRLCRAVHG